MRGAFFLSRWPSSGPFRLRILAGVAWEYTILKFYSSVEKVLDMTLEEWEKTKEMGEPKSVFGRATDPRRGFASISQLEG